MHREEHMERRMFWKHGVFVGCLGIALCWRSAQWLHEHWVNMEMITLLVFGSEFGSAPPRRPERHKQSNLAFWRLTELAFFFPYKQLDSIQKVLCEDNNPVTLQLHKGSQCFKQFFMLNLTHDRNIYTFLNLPSKWTDQNRL